MKRSVAGIILLLVLLAPLAAPRARQGTPLAFARSIEQRALALGAAINYSTRVDLIIVKGGRAMGVQLADSGVRHGDYVTSA